MRRGCYYQKGAYINFKYNFFEYVSQNRLSLIILAILLLLSLLTGIFTGIKCGDYLSDLNFNDYSIIEFIKGNLGTKDLFMSRLISYEVTLIIISLTSMTIFLCPLLFGMIVVRSYLVGLNCTFIVILCGFSGALTSILIIFPCQLLMLIIIFLYSSMILRRGIYKHKYRMKDNSKVNCFLLFIIFSLILCLLNTIESLLLSVFVSKISLVI